jgi:hypothetical protein
MTTTTWMINSAVLAAGEYGTYGYEPCSWDDLRAAIMRALAHDGVVSRIGYAETADLIERQTGWRPPLSREPSALAVGDVAYVVRLRYRVEPARKGAPLGADLAAWEVARLTRLS